MIAVCSLLPAAPFIRLLLRMWGGESTALTLEKENRTFVVTVGEYFCTYPARTDRDRVRS